MQSVLTFERSSKLAHLKCMRLLRKPLISSQGARFSSLAFLVYSLKSYESRSDFVISCFCFALQVLWRP